MRRGVTLLEVLFSIVIAAVGVFGVIATLLIAGHRASDAGTIDGADRLGRSAVRDFHVRSLNQATGMNGTWATVPVNGWPYAIDPLYVAANGTASPACWFPAFDPTIVPGVRLGRISLRPIPGDQATNPLPPITSAVAESIFVARDDLVFNLPNDRTLPPQQKYGPGAEVREYGGSFSWLATIQAENYATGPALAHIVVMHRRDLQEPDVLLNVEKIDGTAFKLSVRPGQSDDDLDIKEGRWFLLTGRTTAGAIRIGWQRVTDQDDVIPAGTADIDGTICPTDSRWFNLAGRDWDCLAANSQAAVVGPVVAVYERPCRMVE